jgi:hypothetical protein
MKARTSTLESEVLPPLDWAPNAWLDAVFYAGSHLGAGCLAANPA